MQFLIVLLLPIVFSPAASAGPTEEVKALWPTLEPLYRDLHAHPELSFQETATAAKLAERLKALGFEVATGVGKTGVVGILRNGAGKTVMLRTDMDALPVEEKTGLPYASRMTGTSTAGQAGSAPRPGEGLQDLVRMRTCREFTKAA
jgi:hypothetical protein